MDGSDYLIAGGRVIDPSQGIDQPATLRVRDGRIAGIGALDMMPADLPRLDASGLLVCPGLVDTHVHLREPGAEHKETIATGLAAAAAGGFTTVCCMPNTQPAIDTADTIDFIQRKAAASGACHLHVIAAATVGRKGHSVVDVPTLHNAGAVAFSDDGDGIEDDAMCRKVMEAIRDVGSVLYPHCEFKALSRSGVMHLGAVSRRLGLVGYDPRGEEAMIERDLRLVEQTGVRYHVAHISTRLGIAMIAEAKARGLPVSTEVCPHHLLLCDEDVVANAGTPDAMFKMSPPLRSADDVAACISAVRDGTIDCIVTDHAPHAEDEKAAGFAEAPMGIVGLETSLATAAKACLGGTDFSWTDLIERMSTAPARMLNLPAGSLSEGTRADICLIDPQEVWTVQPVQFCSKSLNTPFGGWQLTGRSVVTILGGALVHAAHRDRVPGWLQPRD